MKNLILPLTILVSLASCQSETDKLRETEKRLWVKNDSLNKEITRLDSICLTMRETAYESGNYYEYITNPVFQNFQHKRENAYNSQTELLGDIHKVQEKIKSIELGLK